MVASLGQTISLFNGVEIPQLGFGTFKIVDLDEAKKAVAAALACGYRAFDTAELYKNEQIFGEVFQQCGVKREALFITTKVANDSQGYDNTLRSFDRSLKALQLEYVDLYLFHWPLKATFFDTWRAIETIYENKLARAIGVCNFHKSHLELLKSQANIKPMIDQIEIHPYLPQIELTHYLQTENIAIEAWSPLARGKVNEDAILVEIANKYQKSPSQITLRWHLQKGFIVIPKSSHAARIKQNSELFDFALTPSEMQRIDSLDSNFRTGPNPEVVYEKNGF